MADPFDDIERTLKSLREAGKHDTQVRAMVAQISTALGDVVPLLEKLTDKQDNTQAIVSAITTTLREGFGAMAAPTVNVAAPVVNLKPVMQSDWTSLRVDMAVNTMGRPTGAMTITKIK